AINCRLRRTAPRIGWRERIQPILQHIKVKRAQVDDTEIMDSVKYAVELERVISFAALPHQFSGTGEHPTIDFPKINLRQVVVLRIKIREVPRHKSKRIPNFAVGFR